TLARRVARVGGEAGVESSERARTALEVVLASLVRRLTDSEAKDLIAQRRSLLQGPLRSLPPGPDKSIASETIEAELAKRLDVDRQRAGQLLAAVGRTLAQWISPGQMEDVRSEEHTSELQSREKLVCRL